MSPETHVALELKRLEREKITQETQIFLAKGRRIQTLPPQKVREDQRIQMVQLDLLNLDLFGTVKISNTGMYHY